MQIVNLSGQIEFAVERLKVLDCITSDKLLVEPDLMIGSRARKQVLARSLRKRVDLVMELGQCGNRGYEDITETTLSASAYNSER